MHNQMNDFFINKLSTNQCLSKRFEAQQCFLLMIKKLQGIKGNKRVFAAVFTDQLLLTHLLIVIHMSH